jgi:hypothetical protein
VREGLAADLKVVHDAHSQARADWFKAPTDVNFEWMETTKGSLVNHMYADRLDLIEAAEQVERLQRERDELRAELSRQRGRNPFSSTPNGAFPAEGKGQ